MNPNAFAYLNRPEQLPNRGDAEDNLSPPKVVVPLSNIHTVEGRPCRLVSRIEGNPVPHVCIYLYFLVSTLF